MGDAVIDGSGRIENSRISIHKRARTAWTCVLYSMQETEKTSESRTNKKNKLVS